MLKSIVTGILSLILVTPAFAWGEREQGIISGIAGYWLYQRLTQPQVVVTSPPVATPVPSGPAPIHPHYTLPPATYFNCLVQVYDPSTNSYRNEVFTCVK